MNKKIIFGILLLLFLINITFVIYSSETNETEEISDEELIYTSDSEKVLSLNIDINLDKTPVTEETVLYNPKTVGSRITGFISYGSAAIATIIFIFIFAFAINLVIFITSIEKEKKK